MHLRYTQAPTVFFFTTKCVSVLNYNSEKETAGCIENVWLDISRCQIITYQTLFDSCHFSVQRGIRVQHDSL